ACAAHSSQRARRVSAHAGRRRGAGCPGGEGRMLRPAPKRPDPSVGVMSVHVYESSIGWSGSTGAGYASYSRDHRITLGESTLTTSADPAFHGDAHLPNPEQLLLAAASSCQMLSFLGAAARAGVDVLDYRDDATAIMPTDS